MTRDEASTDFAEDRVKQAFEAARDIVTRGGPYPEEHHGACLILQGLLTLAYVIEGAK